MNKLFLSLTFFVVIVGGMWMYNRYNPPEPGSPSLYEIAPDFELHAPSGDVLTAEELKGHIIVLDFWASWCGPCLMAFPNMQEIVDRYEDNPHVLFLAVNTGDDTLDEIAEFSKTYPYTFNYVRDQQGMLTFQYASLGIPALAILDTEGRLRYHKLGYTPDNYIESITSQIDDLLGKENLSVNY